MGFSTALSGLTAAAKDLQVTGNNIANANTSGFKESRTEFADVYAASVGGVSKTQAGAGARVSNVAQQFNQGNLAFTNNNLDIAISGQGFFSLAADPSASKPTLFSRAGEFKMDNEGFIVDNQSNYLMTFAANGTTVEEGFSEGVFQPLKVNSAQGKPDPTSKILTAVNLNSEEVVPVNFPLDPADSRSYNHTSSVTIYDSQGNAHIASTYYATDRGPTSGNPPTATGTPNQWQAYFFIDGVRFNPDGSVPATPADQQSTQLTFDNSGVLTSPTDPITYGPFNSTSIDPGLNVDPLSFTFDFGETTQFSANFSVLDLSQDGLPSGNLTGISVDDKGVVAAQFSNGAAEVLGKIALTRFANTQGLAKAGNTAWKESSQSGEAVSGQAGTGNFGLMQSGALESSNVDLSAQLVHLIIAQQAYQANAQTITTEKTIMQTILNA